MYKGLLYIIYNLISLNYYVSYYLILSAYQIIQIFI